MRTWLSPEGQISTLVSENNPLNKQVELLTSINGIGDVTACSILAYLGDISLFNKSAAMQVLIQKLNHLEPVLISPVYLKWVMHG